MRGTHYLPLTDRYKELQKIDYKPVDYGNDFFKDSLVSINGCKTDGHASSDKAVLSDMADKIYMSKSMLPEIYARCDPEILWNDIQLGNSAEDLLMDDKTWRFCRSISKSVIDGDIGTYWKVISELAPVDDLLLYGSDFQFGTDTPLYMEIEFIVYPEELLEKAKEDSLLSQYVLAVSIRVARDLFALLPIETIIVHVMCESKDIFSGIFERKELKDLDFSNDIDFIIKYIKFRACNYTDAPVKRFGS